jgi:hypothetical protein
MAQKYILDESDNPIAVDLMTWAKWFEGNEHRRKVDRTDFADGYISTVFLGLDHQFGAGPPMIYETMIFGGNHDQYQERCSTLEEAKAMHAKAVKLVQDTTFP